MKSEVKIKTTFINIFFFKYAPKIPQSAICGIIALLQWQFLPPIFFWQSSSSAAGRWATLRATYAAHHLQHSDSIHTLHPRSPSRNLKSFSICDETGNEQGFQYQRQTIISADHYILAWKKLLNWEFCLQRSCTNAVAGGTRGLIFANVDRSQW